MKFDLTKLDIQMMKDIDSLPQKSSQYGNIDLTDDLCKGVVWMRDDYLSMRGMAFCGDRKTYDLLELVAQLKEQLRKEGYEFNCDKWYEGEK